MPRQISNEPTADTIDKAGKLAVDFHEGVAENAASLHRIYLRTCDSGVERMTGSYAKAIKRTKLPVVGRLAAAQADVTRGVTKAYLRAIR